MTCNAASVASANPLPPAIFGARAPCVDPHRSFEPWCALRAGKLIVQQASRRGSSSTPRGPLCPLLRGLSRRRPRNRSSTCSWVSEAVCRAAGLDPFFPNAWLIESTVQQHQTGLPAVGTIAKIPIADHWQASFPCAGNLIAGSYCRAYIRLWPPSRAFWNNRLRRKRQIYTRSSDVDRPSWRACVIDRYHPVSTFAPMCTRSSWG